MHILKGKERKSESEILFKEIIVKNFPNLRKKMIARSKKPKGFQKKKTTTTKQNKNYFKKG